MLRALGKGTALALLGRLPGGAHAYRELTRVHLGTQASHVDKLRRVLPGYVAAWRELGGLELEGRRVWIHEPGWTPFWALACYLLTGRGGTLTNVEARLLDRYLARAVNGVLELPLGAPARRRRVEALRWCRDSRAAIRALSAELHDACDPVALPLTRSSVDLVHSGGALEHYAPDLLRGFLAECRRVVRPGGLVSHVLDHRDHLYHADHAFPFLAHLALPAPLYGALLGGALTYHNRLAPAQVAALFEEAGFRRIAVRRLVLPSHAYVSDGALESARPGLPQALLAREHRGLSEADRRTAAAHYLYRRS